jgi:hypothetical protein
VFLPWLSTTFIRLHHSQTHGFLGLFLHPTLAKVQYPNDS